MKTLLQHIKESLNEGLKPHEHPVNQVYNKSSKEGMNKKFANTVGLDFNPDGDMLIHADKLSKFKKDNGEPVTLKDLGEEGEDYHLEDHPDGPKIRFINPDT